MTNNVLPLPLSDAYLSGVNTVCIKFGADEQTLETVMLIEDGQLKHMAKYPRHAAPEPAMIQIWFDKRLVFEHYPHKDLITVNHLSAA